MIHSLSSNKASFKSIEFKKGLNIILADRNVLNENSKQTRNGAGKTTIIEIIHFCLGSSVKKDSIFKCEHLKGWSFILKLDIDNAICTIERFVDSSNKIYVSSRKNIGDIFEELKYDGKNSRYYLTLNAFNEQMLNKFYGIKKSNEKRYYPTFRELISYTIRRGIDGYKSCFDYFSPQKAYSIQSCNAYFLGLSLECANKFQFIKDKKKEIDDFKKISKSGLIGNYNIGKLNTNLVSKERETTELKKQLDSFKVHPQYKQISNKVNFLTKKIHSLNDDCIIEEKLLLQYEDSVNNENEDIDTLNEIKQLYNEAGVFFPNDSLESLKNVISFHKSIQKNRKVYLTDEIVRIKQKISLNRKQIESYSNERAELMSVLKTHGALEEYVLLQNNYIEKKKDLDILKERLKSAEEVENLSSNLKIENGELLIEARKDYNDRVDTRAKALSLFSNNTSFLYPEPGNLTIDLNDTGYKFNVEMKNSRSQGVNYMKIFSYDFMVLELNNYKLPFPDFIIHDSTIFDGVDERQVARALILAYNKCKQMDSQYICMLNSDKVPGLDFDDDFLSVFNESIRLSISDDRENGGVLGIRF